MDLATWTSWKNHVDEVVATRGKWFGLGNADGEPLYTLPDPISDAAPEQWLASEDLEVTFPALTPDGDVLPATQLLVMDDMRSFDPSGRLPTAERDYTLLVAFPGPGDTVLRRGGTIVHTDASDPLNTGVPNEIVVHALNAMDVWNTIPAISWPAAWWAAKPFLRESDESDIKYLVPRRMARVEMASHLTFTWKSGPAAFVIRRLMQESLDAVMMTQADPDGTRWVDDPFHVVEVPEMDTSEHIELQAQDAPVWDTVVGQAKNAGVLLGARIWWPGDAPVRCWTPAKSTMTPEQVDISPSQGEPYRTLDYRTFPHAMIVITVKEVV